jgi:hypothetical protein
VNTISLFARFKLHLWAKPIPSTFKAQAMSTLPWKLAVIGYVITIIE